ncbi:MAG: phage holin family protein [Armatimonadota bacterium]
MRFALKWVLFAVALYLTFWSGQRLGLDMAPSPHWQDVAVMSLLLGLVNALVRPLMRLALLPLNCLTVGLAGLIANALLFWLVFAVAPFGFRVGNFWAALYGSVVLGIIHGLLSGLLLEKRAD